MQSRCLRVNQRRSFHTDAESLLGKNMRKKISAAVLAALALGCSNGAVAAIPDSAQDDPSVQSPTDSREDAKKAKHLEAVTVTGSLIPQSQIDTATPVYTITADQLKAQGFTTVAQALQQCPYMTDAGPRNTSRRSNPYGSIGAA